MIEPQVIWSAVGLHGAGGIFEAVWNMESDSCHSSVVNVIYNLQKKIEPDCKNPFYLKTVLGIGYKFSADSVGK